MQILNEFGVNPVLLVAQIVNFLIIFFVLKRFFFKPVLESIKNRQKEIEKGLENSEKAKIVLAKAQEEEKDILHKAQARAEKIIEQAKTESKETKDRADIEAKRESDAMLEQAKAQIAEETKKAEENLTKNIGNIAISLLEKSIQGIFGKKEQQILVKKADEQIRKAKI